MRQGPNPPQEGEIWGGNPQFAAMLPIAKLLSPCLITFVLVILAFTDTLPCCSYFLTLSRSSSNQHGSSTMQLCSVCNRATTNELMMLMMVLVMKMMITVMKDVICYDVIYLY